MEFVIGSVLTVAIVMLLLAAIPNLYGLRPQEMRGATYMLLICVPALAIQTDLLSIAALASLSLALFEIVTL